MLLMTRSGCSTSLKVRSYLSTEPSLLADHRRSKSPGPSSSSFNAVPKRTFFRLLKHFAADEREREKLEEFSSPEGAVDVPLVCSGLSSTYAHTGGAIRVCNQASSHDPRGGRRVPLRARSASVSDSPLQ